MESKVQFIVEWEENGHTFAELCRRFEISRETGYKWVARFRELGMAGLEERSRAPHTRPHAMDEGMRRLVVELRGDHPSWGAKKLRELVVGRQSVGAVGPDLRVPAPSTIGDLLSREGMIYRRRRKRVSVSPGTSGLFEADRAGALWSIDYKGKFQTGNGIDCHPLTIMDNHSRKLLRLRAMEHIDQNQVRRDMEGAFGEFGLPDAIRSDNGTPFTTLAPGGLSELSVWWMELGIRHERIDPGRPDQNGKHERMHPTLVRDCLDFGVEYDCRLQQRRFARFMAEYNGVRPHEALEGMKTPDQTWGLGGGRAYTGRVPEMNYGAGFESRRADHRGRVLCKGVWIGVTPVVAGHRLGLRENEDELHEVYFGEVFLGWLDWRERVFVSEQKAQSWADRAARAEARRVARKQTSAGPSE